MLCAAIRGKKNRSRPGQCPDGLEPAHRQILQNERAAVRLYDIARNAQAEAAATRVTVSRGFESIKRLKHPVQLLVRDAGTFIPDADYQRGAVLDNHRRLRSK